VVPSLPKEWVVEQPDPKSLVQYMQVSKMLKKKTPTPECSSRYPKEIVPEKENEYSCPPDDACMMH